MKALNLADEAQVAQLIAEANDRELAAFGEMFQRVHAVICGYCDRVLAEQQRRQHQSQGAPHLSGVEAMSRALEALDSVLHKPSVDGAFEVPGDDKIH
jgi:hypothetical protein